MVIRHGGWISFLSESLSPPHGLVRLKANGTSSSALIAAHCASALYLFIFTFLDRIERTLSQGIRAATGLRDRQL